MKRQDFCRIVGGVLVSRSYRGQRRQPSPDVRSEYDTLPTRATRLGRPA